MSRLPCHRILWFVIVLLFAAQGALRAVPNPPPFGVYSGRDFSPTIQVLESNSSRIRLDLDMDHLPPSDTINFSRPIPGLWGDLNQDSLLVPRFTIYLALEGNGAPSVSVDTVERTTYPAASTWVPYNYAPQPLVALGHVGIMGGVRVVPVTFSPLVYTNYADTCQVMRHAVVRIELSDSAGENPVASPPTAFSRTWQKVFQSLVTNWDFIPNFRTTEQSHILMIVPDAGSDSTFLPAILPYIQWKEQRGIKVTVVGRKHHCLQSDGAADPELHHFPVCGLFAPH